MSRNDITGDKLVSSPANKSYRDNIENIYGENMYVPPYERELIKQAEACLSAADENIGGGC